MIDNFLVEKSLHTYHDPDAWLAMQGSIACETVDPDCTATCSQQGKGLS